MAIRSKGENLDIDYNPFYSRDDIANDIAISKNYLPEWLIITPKDFSNKQKINVRYVVQELKNIEFDPENQDFLLRYFEEIKDLTYFKISSKDVAFIWLSEKKYDRNMYDFILGSLQLLNDSSFYNSNMAYDGLKSWENILVRKLNKHRQHNEQVKKESQKVMALPEVKFSNIINDEISFEQLFTNKYGELLYIFNEIDLNSRFPFSYIKVKGKMSTEEWYKVLTHTKIENEWLTEVGNLKLEQNENEKILLVYQYSFQKYLYLTIIGNKIIYDIETDVSGNLQKDLIKDLKALLGKYISFGKNQTYNLKLRFTIEDMVFNKAILLDMIFNNELMAKFLTSDESVKTGLEKRKFGIVFMESKPEMRLNISMNISDMDGSLVAKITKGKSMTAINYFFPIFGRLLSLYKKEYDNISTLYKELIPTFVTKGEFKQNRQKISGLAIEALKESKPDMFIRGWVKDCPSDRQPKIASEDEIAMLEDEEILRYPDNDEGDYYTCVQHEQSGFKYVGLRPNKLENKDKYPYLPCCFKEPVLLDDGSSKKNQKNRPLSANKVAGPGREAYLSSNVENIFTSLKFPGTYRRLGFENNQNSLLSCMEYAIGNTSNLNYEKIRKDLAKMRNVSYQEMYDYSEQDFFGYLQYDELNYELIYRMLEKYYDCQIICFENKHPIRKSGYKSEILFPRSYNIHFPSYSSFMKKNVVFIVKQSFENKHQYELIIDLSSRKKSRFSGDYIDRFKEKYQWMIQTFIVDTNKRLSDYFNTFVPPEIFTHQEIDDIGKCTGLYSQEYNVLISIIPSAPYDLPLLKNKENLNKSENLKAFLKTTKYEKSGRKILIPGLLYSLLPDEINDQSSVLVDDFRKKRKIAYYLQQYSLWLSSKLNRFLGREDFMIIPNHEYLNITNVLSEDSSFIYNKKIVVSNEKTRINLLQYSTLFRKNYPKELTNYKFKKYVKNPFFLAKDFKYHESNLIFNTLESMQKYFLSRQIQKVKNTLDISTMLPYLYEWQNKYVIVQNTASSDVEYALKLIHDWNRSTINRAPVSMKIKGKESANYKIYPIDKLGKLETYTLVEYKDDEKIKYLSILHLKL